MNFSRNHIQFWGNNHWDLVHTSFHMLHLHHENFLHKESKFVIFFEMRKPKYIVATFFPFYYFKQLWIHKSVCPSQHFCNMIRSPLIYCLFLSISLERSSLIHHYIPYYMCYLVSTRHTFCTPNVKVGPQLTDKYAHLKGRYVSCRLHFNNNKNMLLLEIHLLNPPLFK